MSTWRIESFDAVIADESSGNLKTLQSEFLRSGRYPIIDQGKELIAGYTDDKSRLCHAKLPVIIFGDHTRCFKYVDFPFCMGADGVKVLRPKGDDHVKYLYYYLRQLRITDGGYDRHFKYLKRSRIPLPSLSVQQRIVEVLDHAEALRAKRRAALAQLNSLTQSVFFDLFGDPVANPNDMKVVRLADVATRITDGVHLKPNYTDRGIPFISVKDITTGKLVFDNCKFISPEDHQRFTKRCKPERLDILYTKIGTYGRPALIETDREFSIYVSVCLIKLRKELVDPHFLSAALTTSAIKNQADKSIKGIGVPDLHLDQIQSFLIPLPPMNEQREFARRIAKVETLKQTQRASLAEMDELFASLQDRAFRGEL